MTEQPSDDNELTPEEYAEKYGVQIPGRANLEQCKIFAEIVAKIFGAGLAEKILPSGWLEGPKAEEGE